MPDPEIKPGNAPRSLQREVQRINPLIARPDAEQPVEEIRDINKSRPGPEGGIGSNVTVET